MSPVRLPALGIVDRYRTDRNDVLQDFYLPCLRTAIRYDRAVGYFTGDALRLLARGLDAFERSGGRIRLIAGPHLTESDVEQIRNGYAYREVVDRAILRELDPDRQRSTVEAAALGLLGRLVANGSLDIKIALVRTSSGMALYHEKIGVFVDADDNTVAFNGSLNETASAFLSNFESIEVFASWRNDDRARSLRIRRDFDDLWNNRADNVEVLDFPDAARDRLLSLAHHERTAGVAAAPTEPVRSPTEWARTPPDIQLRDYQRDAVDAWLTSGGRGIFRMATGTGKTVTALAALDQLGRQLRRKAMPLLTVVVVPLLDLVEQWSDTLERFGIRPVKCRDSVANWLPVVQDVLLLLDERQVETATLVVTNSTFGQEAFQQVLSRVRHPLLLIADEAHHLGSEHLRAKLPEQAHFRLALSATPERWLDDEGTEVLTEYFGPILVDLGMAEAIERGALIHYRYTPVLVPLAADENEYYAALTYRIGALLGGADADLVTADSRTALGELLRKRAQVLGHASAKLSFLESELRTRRNSWYQLIYCAEGAPPAEEAPVEKERQVEAVLDLVGNKLGLSAHPFTSREDKRTRARLLRRFSSGDDLRFLVSMRCLDEGVDIPEARVAYMLASSSNPRQFVQRRGRILRRAPGKERAEIIDFVAVPPRNQSLYNVERSLFRRELIRCLEFARHSDNYGQALAVLRELRDYYGLVDMRGTPYK